MSDNRGESVEHHLFPSGTDFDDKEKDCLLEQYKLFVGTSETLVRRRQGVNTFFLSVNSLIITGIGLVWNTGSSWTSGDPDTILMVLGVTGVLLAYAWHKQVRSYSQLNKGKFVVIHLLERHLPASIFDAEWKALGQGKDKKRYIPFTSTETLVAWVFGVLYLVSMFEGLIGFQTIWSVLVAQPE